MLKVSLNDAPFELAPNTSLHDALSLMNVNGNATKGPAERPGGRFVIAINQEFVPRSEYASVILMDGDEIDLVRPVWGG